MFTAEYFKTMSNQIIGCVSLGIIAIVAVIVLLVIAQIKARKSEGGKVNIVFIMMCVVMALAGMNVLSILQL